MPAGEGDSIWTVHQLRRRWKPTKERLSDADELPEVRIRIHRCCSWLQRVEEVAAMMSAGYTPMLETVYKDGVLVRDMSFAEVRSNARVPAERIALEATEVETA